MEKFPVKVDCVKSKRWQHSRSLWLLHLHWNGINGFEGNITKKNIERLSNYCKMNRLHYFINDKLGKRSYDYRKKFFEENEPIFSDRYLCVYCGYPIKKDKITVDHLYPVSVAGKSIRLQKKLRKMGIDDINDIRNLVPACRSCNSKKGAKMGIWILKGKIGRHTNIWIMRHILRLIIFCTIIVYMYKMGYFHKIYETFSLYFGQV